MHTATDDEIDRAAEIATALHARFNRLMDARVGVGQWSNPTKEAAPKERAAMEAESAALGWLYVAKSGQPLRWTLDECLRRCAKRLELWGLPVPEIIRTGPNQQQTASETASG